MNKIASNKIDDKHYVGHLTFWAYAKSKYHIKRPNKYCVIFNTWRDIPESFSCTEYDTLNEALEEAKEINKLYANTPKPIKVYDKNGKYHKGINWWNKQYNWDFSDGRYFWGYAVLDMINCKFIKVANGLNNKVFSMSSKPELRHIDLFFRGEDEIPQDYKWDTRGEYLGWLQFRWGDRKNAISYVEEAKQKRTNKQKTIIVGWEDPLPKRIEGIKYIRPNNEPVLFPGDFGYEGDEDNPNPWSLTEEITQEEYIDNGGTLDKKETTSSIADMLGEDNPLLKLKFD